MPVSPLAGQPAPPELLIDVAKLEHDYYDLKPDMSNPAQQVSFGTSGHRGSPFDGTFTEAHILAITQAICEYRAAHGIAGPLMMGKDTHAASGPAEKTAIEVLAANGVETWIQQNDGVNSHAGDLARDSYVQRGKTKSQADGIVITPSHNPAGRRRVQVQPAQWRPGRH